MNPNSTYTYRVRAFNADGNSGYSNEASATTQSQPNPPAAPSNLTATAVSTSQIDLSWTDNSNNEDGFKIERKDPGATTFVEIAQVGANVTNYSDTGLNPNSTYTYRVRAFNADGNSGYSNEASATTQSQPNPPAAPSNLTATAVSTSQIDLSWTDNSNNEDGFKIERKDPGSTTFVEIAQVGANVTNYSDTGLNPNSTYTYRVRAFNADGNSGYSNEASATTQSAGNNPPTATIIQPVAGKTYPRGQNLCFYGEATDPEDGELPASQFEWRADLPNGVTDYLVAQGVKFGSANPTLPGTYTLKLIVTDFDGNQTITTIQFTASNNAPTNQPPTAVAQANPTAGVAPLMVQFNADNSSDPDGTLRYSWDFGDGNTSDKKNPTHTYTNPGTYTAVLTVTDDNCATATDQVTITVNSGTPNPPAAPSNLTATAVSTSQIDLSWTDNSNNEDGFKIERKDPGSTTFVEIAQVGANVTNYSDTGLNPNSTYTYRVRAFNADGNSGYSNEASATTQSQPNPPAAPSNLTATAVSTSQIDLSWTDNSNNEDGFKIERKDPGSTTFVEIAQVGANVTNYSDTGLNPNSTYTYRVRAFNADGNSGYSNEASATTQSQPNPPAAPSNLTATAVSTSQIDLSWTDNSNNEDGFKIERKDPGPPPSWKSPRSAPTSPTTVTPV
ncbi:MAG: fibronectin type III domain-containing protein [candidate division KSB1 bacterium]|nr:fibronectin type III domain-containing protein [candidate division KSB1 bacterium]